MSASEAQTFRSAVLVAAAGLGQAAADQVTDCQQGDQEPAVVGAEPLTVLIDVDHPRGDQHSDDCQDVDDQLGGLERGLGLPGEAAVHIWWCRSAAAGGHVVRVCGAAGHASPYGEWDSTGRFLPGTEDCKWRLGLFGYRPLPCVTCIAHAAIGVPYTPVGSCQTRSTKTSWSAAGGYVPGRCCLHLGAANA